MKITSKLSYISHKIFDNNLVSIRKSKTSVALNKPAYMGICMLDLTKVLMYDFYCNYIKNKYWNNSKLLFTDTDILMHKIKTEDEDFSSYK